MATNSNRTPSDPAGQTGHGGAFPTDALEDFARAYPAGIVKLAHQLPGDALLSTDALADLAAALPADSIEYNPGRLPIGIAIEDIPPPALGVVETIRRIGTADSWVVLKRIEQHPAYAALLDEVLTDVARIVTPRTGAMLQREGFIFLSSPHSVTPFHFDPEHNILLQIRGSKTMTLFPQADEAMFDPRVHEAFHRGEHSRNLPWRDEYAARGEAVTLHPGDAVHVPVKTPHWVQNGPEVSVSLSVTWRSEWSYAEADARALNRMLRRIGVTPKSPAPWPARNRGKSTAWRVVRRLGG